MYALVLAIDGVELRYHSQIEMKENSSGGGRKEGIESVEKQQIYEEVEIYC